MRSKSDDVSGASLSGSGDEDASSPSLPSSLWSQWPFHALRASSFFFSFFGEALAVPCVGVEPRRAAPLLLLFSSFQRLFPSFGLSRAASRHCPAQTSIGAAPLRPLCPPPFCQQTGHARRPCAFLLCGLAAAFLTSPAHATQPPFPAHGRFSSFELLWRRLSTVAEDSPPSQFEVLSDTFFLAAALRGGVYSAAALA